MSKFRMYLANAIADGLEPEEAFDRAVHLTDPGDLIEFFRPIGITHARQIRRAASRQTENRVFDRGRKLVATREPERKIDVRGILLSKTFSVGNRLVTWGTATIEDHEQRALEQDQRADDLILDANRHRRAAKLLQDKGAETLDDVEDEDLNELIDE